MFRWDRPHIVRRCNWCPTQALDLAFVISYEWTIGMLSPEIWMALHLVKRSHDPSECIILAENGVAVAQWHAVRYAEIRHRSAGKAKCPRREKPQEKVENRDHYVWAPQTPWTTLVTMQSVKVGISRRSSTWTRNREHHRQKDRVYGSGTPTMTGYSFISIVADA